MPRKVSAGGCQLRQKSRPKESHKDRVTFKEIAGFPAEALKDLSELMAEDEQLPDAAAERCSRCS